MRVFLSLMEGLIASVLTATLAVFAVQNRDTVPLQFLLYAFPGHIWWIAPGAAILGFVVALLLLLPGQVAETWRSRSMTHELGQLAQDLSTAHRHRTGAEAARRASQQQSQHVQAQLRQLLHEREGLIAERDRLRAERNRLRQQLALAQFDLETAPGMGTASALDATPSWASPNSAAGFEEEPVEMAMEMMVEPHSSLRHLGTPPRRSGTDLSAAEQHALADSMADIFPIPAPDEEDDDEDDEDDDDDDEDDDDEEGHGQPTSGAPDTESLLLQEQDSARLRA